MSTLEQLAEMDQLLHDIQIELAPEREPAPPLPPPSPPPAEASPQADSRLQALIELEGRLLASIQELVAGYERVLEQARSSPLLTPRPTPGAPPPPPARRRPSHDDPGVTVSAGPFTSLEALHEFADVLSRLPGVRDVAVRAYEGTDRAIIEVGLERAST